MLDRTRRFILAACMLGSIACGDDAPPDSPTDAGRNAGRDAGHDAGHDARVPEPSFERVVLSDAFYSEGAAAGDFDTDGVLDVVAGPYWYRGPEFTQRHVIYEATAFDPKGYSDNFFSFVRDFDRDGRDDVLVVGFPGEAARWYRNPGDMSDAWTEHRVFDSVDNESPAFADVTGDGEPELVFSTGGRMGFAQPSADPEALWTFHPLSEDLGYAKFTHGLGVGDVNGDGRNDVLEASAWFEQPAQLQGDPLWPRHAQMFGNGGAQMFVYDVDDDGDGDVITTLAAHGYGVAWFERSGTDFIAHEIAPSQPDAGGGVLLHQPHALALVDINGDGLLDVLTGERFWGHVPEGDPDFDAPALLYWFELRRRQAGVEYVPHAIDDASGVGTQVMATDLDGDARPDVIVASKKGAFVFLQRAPSAAP